MNPDLRSTTVHEALRSATASIDRRDAEVLLLHIMRHDRAWLRAHPEALLEPAQAASFFSLVTQRARHWPLQYLTGRQEFFGLAFEVSPDVLIPRPETELLVEAVLAWIDTPSAGRFQIQEIVDVGTGSGAIALALASRLPEVTVLALDISPQVRATFERNAFRLGLLERARFIESDLLAALKPEIQDGRHLEVIVSNPPYVPKADAPALQPEVRDFEPHVALFAGQDGLEVYRRLVPEAKMALRPGGLLAMEFGFGQQVALEELLSGWRNVNFQQDYAGIPRLVLAECPG